MRWNAYLFLDPGKKTRTNPNIYIYILKTLNTNTKADNNCING